jgi:hypothetical protein
MKTLSPELKEKYGWLNPNDGVFTPEPIAEKIVSMFPISGRVLEPCKGEGAFMKYLPEGTEWCEIAEDKDFFTLSRESHYDWIVTNPPYSDFDRFLALSFELADNVVFLVPFAKVFKSMGTLRKVDEYGGMVSIWIIAAGRCGFPFGFPAAAIYFKRDYNGETKITFAES